MLASLKTVSLGELASFEMGQSPDSFFVNDAGYGVPFLFRNRQTHRSESDSH